MDLLVNCLHLAKHASKFLPLAPGASVPSVVGHPTLDALDSRVARSCMALPYPPSARCLAISPRSQQHSCSFSPSVAGNGLFITCSAYVGPFFSAVLQPPPRALRHTRTKVAVVNFPLPRVQLRIVCLIISRPLNSHEPTSSQLTRSGIISSACTRA